jgi:hypothetical protein
MAGETLIAACFGRGYLCRLCGKRISRRKGSKLAHAAAHLRDRSLRIGEVVNGRVIRILGT